MLNWSLFNFHFPIVLDSILILLRQALFIREVQCICTVSWVKTFLFSGIYMYMSIWNTDLLLYAQYCVHVHVKFLQLFPCRERQQLLSLLTAWRHSQKKSSLETTVGMRSWLAVLSPTILIVVYYVRFCTQCNKHADMRRKAVVSIPPQVLIVYLKRFRQDS